jgi:hypothetical protein
MSKKVTLSFEFDVGVPDDLRRLTLTTQAQELALVITGVDERLRQRLKWGDVTPEARTELEAVRRELRESMDEILSIAVWP